MKLVDQRFYWDCFRACTATVLGLEYEDVPEFVKEEPWDGFPRDAGWRVKLRDFLAERNLVSWDIGLHGLAKPMLMFGSTEIAYHFDPRGLWIAAVKSPRIDGTHAVVMLGRDVFHDPHPKREEGHLGFKEATVFVPGPT